MSISNNHYFIKSGLDSDVASLIVKKLAKYELADAAVWDSMINGVNVIDKIRKSKVCWIDPETWISGMAAHFIHVANKNIFGYNLTEWESPLQYTVYDGEGTRYNWHADTRPAESDIVRKLSVSICLTSSNEYDGGEIDIMPHQGKKVYTYKMDVGDVIVFSSDTMHRVRKVKSGKRISLVGWYGGPTWK